MGKQNPGAGSPLALQEQVLWCPTTEAAGGCARLPHQGLQRQGEACGPHAVMPVSSFAPTQGRFRATL